MSVLVAVAPAPNMNRSLVRALVVSLLIHGVLLMWGPRWNIESPVELPPIVATLESMPTAQPGSAPPAPAPQQAPAADTPPRTEPAKPKVERKPRVTPKPERAAPAPQEKARPAPAESPVSTPPAETGESAPATEGADAVVPGADAPDAAQSAGALPQPSGPVVEGSALDAYRAAIYAAAEQYRDYPRYARARGWEGRAVVRLEMDARGRVARIAIVSPTSYEVLDKSALEMVRKAQRDVPVPAALRGRAFSVDVAVLYELKD